MSNSYIFRYAAILVILVAVVLSAAAMFLKPMQDRNIAIAKMKGILQAANLQPDAINAVELYDKYIVKEIVVNPAGEEISIYNTKEKKFDLGTERAFEINLKEELGKKSLGQDYHLPIYLYVNNADTFHILPVHGRGLWGPIYGNIALTTDMNTISGAKFFHDKETPGLGAEIDQIWFSDQYIGKKIFDENGIFVGVAPVKGGVAKLSPEKQVHGVDAISGGTITSNALGKTVHDVLESYVEYLKKNN